MLSTSYLSGLCHQLGAVPHRLELFWDGELSLEENTHIHGTVSYWEHLTRVQESSLLKLMFEKAP